MPWVRSLSIAVVDGLFRSRHPWRILPKQHAEQPAADWNAIAPKGYERLAGEGSQWDWKEQPTLMYNGYGEYVASLYK